MPVFSYGLYFLLSIPSISDIPTTNTPLVYSLTPAILPTGITDVFGKTSTSTFFVNNLSKRLTWSVFFPDSFAVASLLFEEVSIASSFEFISIPKIVFIDIVSPSNTTNSSGKFCHTKRYI